MKSRKAVLCALIGLTGAGFLLQRRRPIPMPPWLTFLLENPFMEAFVGAELLLERAGVKPGMTVLDAGCGPGRLTIPAARVVGLEGEVVALDSQSAMLRKLRKRLDAEGATNVRALRAELGEGELGEGAFDRAMLAMVFGEVRNKEVAMRELHAALKPGGILSVTEVILDPDYRRAATIRREAEAAGFRLVTRHGNFAGYTLNFEKPRALTAKDTPPEALAL